MYTAFLSSIDDTSTESSSLFASCPVMRGTSNLSRTLNCGNELNPVYDADHSARFWQCSWKSPRRIWRARIRIGKELFERIGLLAIVEGGRRIGKDPIARAFDEEPDVSVSFRLVSESHRSADHFVLDPKRPEFKFVSEIKSCAFFRKLYGREATNPNW